MLLDLLLITLTAGAAASAAYHGLALTLIRRSLRAAPPVETFLDDPDAAGKREHPAVCIIVPAHNEGGRVGPLARSLRGQSYADLAIVFVLDRCDDDTEARIKEALGDDPRCEIIHNDACPDDWAGKAHAAWRGVQDSQGARDADLLLFTDADTVFDPRCVEAAVTALRAEDVDMVSLLSRLRRGRWFERIVQPMAVFELLRQHPPHKVNNPDRRSGFANGQFMLFRRDVYDAVGGHERVRSALCEDIAFGRALKRDRRRWLVLRAGRMLECRMYEGWPQFRRGWKRIYIESARRRARDLARRARRMRLLMTLAPLLGPAALVLGALALPGWTAALATASGGAATALWIAAVGLAMRSQGEPWGLAVMSPLGAWLTAGILSEAKRDLTQGRGVAWGGRQYERLSAEGLDVGAAPDRAKAIV